MSKLSFADWRETEDGIAADDGEEGAADRLDEAYAEYVYEYDFMHAEPLDPICVRCHKTPEQLQEYIDMAKLEGYESPSDFVRAEEGTYNVENGHFACTPCYIKMGQPSSRFGWKAP